jgi:hypothetical protein
MPDRQPSSVTLRALGTSGRYDASMRNSILGFDLIKARGLAKARGLIVLVCVLALTATARAEDVEKRKAFAQQLTKDIVITALSTTGNLASLFPVQELSLFTNLIHTAASASHRRNHWYARCRLNAIR